MKRPKRPRDPLALAKAIGDIATGLAYEAQPGLEMQPETDAERWGRLGGVKGGRNRAKNLSVERRHEIARLGARSRWKKSDK